MLVLELPDVNHVLHPQHLLLLLHLDSLLFFVRVFLVLLPLASSVSLFASNLLWNDILTLTTFSPFTELFSPMFTSRTSQSYMSMPFPAFSTFSKMIDKMFGSREFTLARHLGWQPAPCFAKICRVVSFLEPWCKLLWPLCQQSKFLHLAPFLALHLRWQQIGGKIFRAGSIFWSRTKIRGVEIMERVWSWDSK